MPPKKIKITMDKLYCIRKTYYSRIYIVENNPSYLLKEHFFPNKIIHEYKTLKFLRKKNFNNIPEFKLIKINNRQFLSLKKLNKPFLFPNKTNTPQITMLAKTIAKLHNIKTNKTQKDFIQMKISRIKKLFFQYKFIDNYYNNQPNLSLQKTILQYINFIIKFAKKIPLPAQNLSLIHGELFPDHFFLENKKIKIIDWENSCFGDPMYDLATLFNQKNFPQKKFLTHYSGCNDKQYLTKKIKLYQFLKTLNSLLFSILDSIISIDNFKDTAAIGGKKTIYRKEILTELKKIKELYNSIKTI